jgi:cytochrome P450
LRLSGSSPPAHAWIPFGGGIKRCLAANFSLSELTVVVDTLLRAAASNPYTMTRTGLSSTPAVISSVPSEEDWGGPQNSSPLRHG